MQHNDIAITLNRAAMFAIKAHEGQFRKDGVTPYCVHPLRVGMILANHGARPIEILCGFWHDILEDCPQYREELISEIEFYFHSSEVKSSILKTLEAICKPPPNFGNREQRNEYFIQQVINGGESAILVKLCDRIDNVMDSAGLGDFAKQYVLKETGELIYEIGKSNKLTPQHSNALMTLVSVRNAEIIKQGGNWHELPN